MPAGFVGFITAESRPSWALLAAAGKAAGGKAAFQTADTYSALVCAIADTLRGQKRATVGFSILTWNLDKCVDVLQRLRGEFGDRIVALAGGPHPSGDPRGTLERGFDLAFPGEGELFVQKIVRGEEFETYCHRRVSGAIVAPDTKLPPVALDDFAPWCYELPLIRSLELTRGCRNSCRFCQTACLFGSHVRHRSVDNALAHIARASGELGVRYFRFVAPDAFGYVAHGTVPDPAAVGKLLSGAQAIVGPDGQLFFGSFPSEVRPESVTLEMLELVGAYATNKKIAIGVQSGSDGFLKKARRGHGVAEALRAVELTVKSGLGADVDVIFGMPGETIGDMRETLGLCRELTALGATIRAHGFMPLPGTEWADAEPAAIPEEIDRGIENLASAGRLRGQWKSQQLYAK